MDCFYLNIVIDMYIDNGVSYHAPEDRVNALLLLLGIHLFAQGLNFNTVGA